LCAYDAVLCLFVLTRPPPASPLFPYTTLFRSADAAPLLGADRDVLQVGIGARQAARGGDRLVVGRVDAPVVAYRLEQPVDGRIQDRKSTRLNSSHVSISYAVFCLKKKNNRLRH